MFYAVKGNKRLKIDEKEKATYLAMGFDIAKVEGKKLKVLDISPSKTVHYVKFKTLQDENAALKAELDKLKKDTKTGGK